jgi:hypothetical protein
MEVTAGTLAFNSALTRLNARQDLLFSVKHRNLLILNPFENRVLPGIFLLRKVEGTGNRERERNA